MTSNQESTASKIVKNPLLIILIASTVFFLVFMALVAGTLFKYSGSGSTGDKGLFSKHSSRIGVLEVSGVIMDSKKYLEQLEMFEEDKSIKGVVVRINSPGGAVAPSQEIYAAFQKLSQKKPVYSSMSSLAASGGYYIACGTKKIFANPGTITGSIGVIMQFADLSKLYQWAKVNPYNIKTGKFKDIGSPLREMSPEEKDLLSEMMSNVLSQFKKAISDGRKIPLEKVTDIADGRIFSGEQAKSLNLVDEIGGMNDAVVALAKEVGITGTPKLAYIEKKKGFVEWFLSNADNDEDSRSNLSNGLQWITSILHFLQTGTGAAISTPYYGPMYLMSAGVR